MVRPKSRGMSLECDVDLDLNFLEFPFLLLFLDFVLPVPLLRAVPFVISRKLCVVLASATIDCTFAKPL